MLKNVSCWIHLCIWNQYFDSSDIKRQLSIKINWIHNQMPKTYTQIHTYIHKIYIDTHMLCVIVYKFIWVRIKINNWRRQRNYWTCENKIGVVGKEESLYQNHHATRIRNGRRASASASTRKNLGKCMSTYVHLYVCLYEGGCMHLLATSWSASSATQVRMQMIRHRGGRSAAILPPMPSTTHFPSLECENVNVNVSIVVIVAHCTL